MFYFDIYIKIVSNVHNTKQLVTICHILIKYWMFSHCSLEISRWIHGENNCQLQHRLRSQEQRQEWKVEARVHV